jgi:antirestriction protein ArdC
MGQEDNMRARRDSAPSAEKPRPDWSQILIDAVAKPGIISNAYSTFWNYSTGNQLLAMFECMLRRLEPGPIHTFQGWKTLGRVVKKGEKAITLCMPVKIKRKLSHSQPANPVDSETEESEGLRTVFVYRPHWFTLSQTEGKEYVPAELPEWQESRALDFLGIERTAFDAMNGNIQGFAIAKKVAVSPIAAMPHKTLFHELAHVVLGHTEESVQQIDGELTPRNIREVEAETVALICCESLGLPGTLECRGYIQHWLGKEAISEWSAQRVFKAADQILRAGRPPVKVSEE